MGRVSYERVRSNGLGCLMFSSRPRVEQVRGGGPAVTWQRDGGMLISRLRLCGAVPVKVHVQPELIGKIPLKPFKVDLNVSITAHRWTIA
jgi:hypothetical protein